MRYGKRFVALFLCAVMGFGHCVARSAEIVPTALSLTPSSAALYPGWQIELQLLVMPFNADISAILWESTNESVAIVNNGIVEALSPGEASIVAFVDGTDIWAACNVMVYPAPYQSPTVSPSQTPNPTQTPSPAQGQSEISPQLERLDDNFSAILAALNADMPLLLGTGAMINLSEIEESIEDSVAWTSSDTRVAVVDQIGFVSSVGVGRCVVTATFGNRSVSYLVAVVNPSNPNATPAPYRVISIPVIFFSLPETIICYKETDLNELITLTPSNANDFHWTWESSNPRVAIVTADGILTPRSRGEAVIFLKHANVSDTSYIKVTVP